MSVLPLCFTAIREFVTIFKICYTKYSTTNYDLYNYFW